MALVLLLLAHILLPCTYATLISFNKQTKINEPTHNTGKVNRYSSMLFAVERKLAAAERLLVATAGKPLFKLVSFLQILQEKFCVLNANNSQIHQV
jgi:hypothetical protein